MKATDNEVMAKSYQINRVLKSYPVYKDSGWDWLGNVPAHWDVLPGFAVFKEKRQKNIGLQETQVLSLSYGKIVIKPPEKLHGLVPESFDTFQIVDPGDIIIRSTDLQNDWNSLRVGLVKDRGIITSAYICLNIRARITPEYAHLLLHSYDLKKFFYGMGSGLRQNLDFSDFKRMTILVPPWDEQIRIVQFFNWLEYETNRYICAKRRQIELLNAQKQAIIQQAVTRGLDPNVKFQSVGVKCPGGIPEGWEIVRIKYLLYQMIDTEHKTAPFYDDGKYIVARTTNIKQGTFIKKGAKYTDQTGYYEWTKRGVAQPGDILFTREAPAGEACIVSSDDIPLVVGQRVVLFRVNHDELNELFGVYSIYGGFAAKYIQLLLQGSTVPHFNMADIGNIPILKPPLEEQNCIVDFLVQKNSIIDSAIMKTKNEISIIREYRIRLTADIVSGRLDIRQAAQELSEEAALSKAEALENQAVLDDNGENEETPIKDDDDE